MIPIWMRRKDSSAVKLPLQKYLLRILQFILMLNNQHLVSDWNYDNFGRKLYIGRGSEMSSMEFGISVIYKQNYVAFMRKWWSNYQLDIKYQLNCKIFLCNHSNSTG
jgi:hypothetical protein